MKRQSISTCPRVALRSAVILALLSSSPGFTLYITIILQSQNSYTKYSSRSLRVPPLWEQHESSAPDELIGSLHLLHLVTLECAEVAHLIHVRATFVAREVGETLVFKEP